MKLMMQVQLNEDTIKVAGVELDLDSMSDSQLHRLVQAASDALESRSGEKRSSNLLGRLKKIDPSKLDFYADNMASMYTPDSLVRKFAGGFFADTNRSLYAKTMSGILYRYNSRNRKWEKV